MTFENNPLYKVVFESKVHGCKFYGPSGESDYHLSRYVAAGAQNIYSGAGATKDALQAITDKMLELCNDEKNIKSLRTDVTILAQNIQYRLKYPIDEDCALRMGAIYVFMEDEQPEEVHDLFTRRKIAMAKGDLANKIPADPELYAFFLNTGIENTPSWKESEIALSGTAYFRTREEALFGLVPVHTPQP